MIVAGLLDLGSLPRAVFNRSTSPRGVMVAVADVAAGNLGFRKGSRKACASRLIRAILVLAAAVASVFCTLTDTATSGEAPWGGSPGNRFREFGIERFPAIWKIVL